MKDLIDLISDKDRPAFSKLINLLSGTIILIESFLKIAPFEINIKIFESFNCKNNLNNNCFIVKLVSWLWIFYIIFVIFKTFYACIYKGSEFGFAKACLIIHNIEDVLSFIISICSFMFVLFNVIQIHKINVYFFTEKAIFIYIMILIQFMEFVFFHINYKNKKIINNYYDNKIV